MLLVPSLHTTAATLDIRSTKHNLSGNTSTEGKIDERQICVFCHTPSIDVGVKQSQEEEPKKKSLGWQSNVPADHSFVIYDDIGRMGLGKESVGSQSMACLSCHDSVQAFAASGDQSDHPIGVPYRGAQKNPSPVAAVPSKDAGPYRQAQHLKALEDFRNVSRGTVENRTIWWVSQSGNTTRRTRSDLPLYSRTDAESGTIDVPHIECSSCHDPHNANVQLFLRLPSEGSKLCLTCHSK